MRVTIWKNGYIVNIIVAKNTKEAEKLLPGFIATDYKEGDEICPANVQPTKDINDNFTDDTDNV